MISNILNIFSEGLFSFFFPPPWVILQVDHLEPRCNLSPELPPPTICFSTTCLAGSPSHLQWQMEELFPNVHFL